MNKNIQSMQSSPIIYYYSPSFSCSNNIPPSPPTTPLHLVCIQGGQNHADMKNDCLDISNQVYLEGPRDTYYEGGVFQLLLHFPKDYPMSPPTLRFISDFWHPNVYQKEGRVCISILHPPGEDALSGELPQERWLPTQTVSTIILSVMSILSDPNCSSPANVDASVEWRSNREAYKKRCAKLVEKANKQKPSHIVIPHPDTNPEEHKKSVERLKLAVTIAPTLSTSSSSSQAVKDRRSSDIVIQSDPTYEAITPSTSAVSAPIPLPTLEENDSIPAVIITSTTSTTSTTATTTPVIANSQPPLETTTTTNTTINNNADNNNNNTMHLMYYIGDNGERKYTLKKQGPSNKVAYSAHPARFSVDDKHSRERIALKKRFNLLLTQQPPMQY
eukprot:gene7742-9072_t